MDAFSDVRPIPLSVLLSWPTPNYVDPIRRGPSLVIVNSVLLPLAIVIVGLRLYTRLFIIRSAGLDDLFIALAVVPAFGLTVAVCLAASRYSWDVHIWDVPPQNIIPSRQVTWAAQFLFLWATSLTKLSILLFYLRLSGSSMKKIFHSCIFATLIFVVCYTIAMTVSLITVCKPLAGFWNIAVPHHCFNQIGFETTAAVLNIIIEFVIIVLPLPTIWSLHLPKRQKWALSGVFMLGSLVVLADIIRTYYIFYLVTKTYDTTWYGFILWIWVAVEVDIALICASAPVLKPLFKRYFVSSSHSSSSLVFRKRTSNIQRVDRLEGGPPFQDPVQSPVELVPVSPVDYTDTNGETQKALPDVPPSDQTPELKHDNNSEESVFIIQQTENDEKKSKSASKNRPRNGERFQKLNNLWARKDAGSSF